MSIILFGKLMVGGTFVVGSSVVVWLGFGKFMNTTIDVYVKTSVTSEGASLEIDSDIKNYECQFDSETKRAVIDGQSEAIEPATFYCEVFQIAIDDKKNYLDWSDFSIQNKKAEKSALSSLDNVFKISISSKHFYVAQDMARKIEVISKTEKETDKKTKPYAKTKTLFAVSGNKKIGKTQYFVGKSKDKSDSSEDIKTYKCSWDLLATKEIAKECKVYDFPSTEKPLIFTKSSNNASAVLADKHYLIEWTETDQPTHKIHPEDDQKQLSIFYNPAIDGKKTIEFIDIQPAFLVGDKLLNLGDNKLPTH